MTKISDAKRKSTTSQEEGADTFEVYQTCYRLVERTNTLDPKPEDVKELRRILAEHPTLWRMAGDTARLASDKAVDQWNTTALVKESTKRGMKALREELGYETAAPMERMLIEQVILCWVNLNIMELVHNDRLAGNHVAEDGLYWDRRLSSAQRRFTHACNSLARVRKLMLVSELHKAQLDIVKASPRQQVKPLRTLKSA